MTVSQEVLELGRRAELFNMPYAALSEAERDELAGVHSFAHDLGYALAYAIVGGADGINSWSIWQEKENVGRDENGNREYPWTHVLDRNDYLEGPRG